MRTESPSYFIRLGAAVAVGLLAIFFHQGGLVSPLREGIFWSLKPGLLAAQILSDAGTAVGDGIQFWLTGTQRLAAAEHELALQRVSKEQIQELEKENRLLRRELGRKQPSQVTLRFFGGGKEWFVDGGCRQGIEKGAPVLFEGSLVGKILEASPYFSVVQTVIDPNFRLPVHIGSAAGLLESSRGITEVTQLSARDIIEVGDSISSRGLERIPPSLPIGRVRAIERSEATGIASALVELFFPPGSIDFATVPVEQENLCP